MITEKDMEEARDAWEQVEKFSESLLGDGPLSIFSIAKESEPTKTMLEKEKAFAIGCIATKLAEAAEKARIEAADRAVVFIDNNHNALGEWDCVAFNTLRAAILKEVSE